MESKQPLHISVTDGEPFFANESTIHFNPTQFVLDFKCISPRMDQRNPQGTTMVMHHNVVLLEPWHMKMLHAVLSESLKRFETEFGTIEKPKAIELWEKRHQHEPAPASIKAPDYLG